MVSIGVGKCHQTTAVEVNTVVVSKVRILPRIHSSRLKPDLAFGVIHFIHKSHDPFALSDLVLYLTGDSVVQIEVLPTIPLRSPNDLFTIVHVITVAPSS